ncbi:hypothetical protein FOL46_000969 [Perkinsus olseni]|uniref:RING-type domain-containing protein n=1 Tax=Perkinsus olseni TaxID=32597 RepID=A0A7J6MFG3_PEROL|nr:hypothetical protein FOL46_000969 [Perkinsus olseni]
MLASRQQFLGALRQALRPPAVCAQLGAACQIRGGFYEGSNKDHRQISMPVPRNVRPNVVVKGIRKVSAKLDVLKTQTKIRSFEGNSMYRIRKLNERAYFRKWHYLRYAVETLNFYARNRAPLSILPKEDPSHLEMRLLNPVLPQGDPSRKKARFWFKPDGFSEKELWQIADEVAEAQPKSSGQRLSFESRGIAKRHGVWASDLQCEDIAESGWLWKKSKVVGTWRLRWCCVVMSQRALLSFEEKPDWLHNTHLQQSPTEKIPLVTCDLNEFQDTSCPGFTIDNRAFALPGSASSRHALLNWLMAIAFAKGDEDTINRCVDLACEDVPKEDFDQCGLVHSDIDSAVSTDFSNSADDFAIYVHGTTGDHVALDCLELADLWLVPVASNRAKTASCELCHRLRARQDLCETRPCGHIFHVDCLYGWTRQSITHDFCPHCHTTFVYEGDGDAAGGSYFPSR